MWIGMCPHSLNSSQFFKSAIEPEIMRVNNPLYTILFCFFPCFGYKNDGLIARNFNVDHIHI